MKEEDQHWFEDQVYHQRGKWKLYKFIIKQQTWKREQKLLHEWNRYRGWIYGTSWVKVSP